MASMPIYGKKNLKNLLPWNQWTDFHELWYVAQGTHYDPGMALTYFIARSSFATLAFIQENATMIEKCLQHVA